MGKTTDRMTVDGVNYEIMDASARSQISAEVTARTAKDTAMQNQIDAMNIIPEFDDGQNLLDLEHLIDNSYINENTGELVGNTSAYKATDFIPIHGDNLTFIVGDGTGFAIHAAYYNKDKEYISAASFPNSSVVQDEYYGHNSVIRTSVVPTGGKFLRFSMQNAGYTYSPAIFTGYAPRTYKPFQESGTKINKKSLDARYPSALNASVGGVYNNSHICGTFNYTLEWKLGVISSLMGPEMITFYGIIDTMGEIQIGFRGTTYQFVINSTQYGWKADGSTSYYDHNLTIKDYIAIQITRSGNGGGAKVRITTNGGTKVVENSTFTGTKGQPTITTTGGIYTFARAAWMPMVSRPIWAFGDSYFSAWSPARWPYYLFDWGLEKNILLNAFPGQTAQSAIEDFENLLQIGSPRYAVWCMGMNNPDSSAINSDWKTATEKFISLCDEYNVEPVLATIPNVPSRDHTYKNAWIRSTGLRYIDFAKALNADSAGAEWFDGMLAPDPDLVHPTALGAICMANCFVATFPEVAMK